jgi:hypothetical protein
MFRSTFAVLGLAAAIASSLTAFGQRPDGNLPLPGELFKVDDRPAFLIASREAAANKPWVWYAPTLSAYPASEEKWMFERFAAAGIAIAGIDVGESYGSPDGRKHFSALYRELTENRGYSRKPILLGRSRGGLMALSWAEDHPDKVGAFAGIYPVCDIASYPGVNRAASAFGMRPDDFRAKLAEHNPVD